MSGLRNLLSSALEGTVVIAGFVAFGLGWAVLEAHTVPPSGLPSERARDGAILVEESMAEPSAAATARVWLVDGFNVLHAGLFADVHTDAATPGSTPSTGSTGRAGRDLGWWTASHRARLLDRADQFCDPSAVIWVVFDGPRPNELQAAEKRRVRTVFAPSADDWLVKRVRSSDRPAELAVVTGDRKVAGRARHAGARIVTPRAFLGLCKEV